MRGDLENLYEAHAHRLYAHCWSLLGDDGAPGALKDTLSEAVRNPGSPPGETVLWLHHLARTVCSERGAFSRHSRPVFAEAGTDPLLSAARNLPAEHREALLLSAGEWLEVRDIARVLRVSAGAVRERLHEARTALERVVLDALMRRTADPAEHMDVIEAFERGRLPNLLARRAPAFAPAPLRDHVLGDDVPGNDVPGSDMLGDDVQVRDAEGADPFGAGMMDAAARDEIGHAPSVPVPPAVPPDPTRPLVVIGSGAEPLPEPFGDPLSDPATDRARRRRTAVKSVGGVAGVAASVAVGLMMTWPSSPDDGTVNAFGPPPDTNTRPGTAPGGGVTEEPGTPKPPDDGGQRNAAPAPAPSTGKRSPATEEPSDPGGGASDPATPPASNTPTTPPSSSPPPSQKSPTPPEEEQPPQDDGDDEDDGSGGPLGPVGDIVGGVLGGLTGR